MGLSPYKHEAPASVSLSRETANQTHSLALLACIVNSSLQFLDHARTITVSFGVDSEALQHRQPHVAQRRVLRQDEMLTQLQVGSAAGENSWAIR